MLLSGGCTDVGRTRPLNEDGYYISEYSKELDAGYAIVADGMGGHQAGEVASAMAIRKISEEINQKFHGEMSMSDLKDLLITAVKQANKFIYEKALAEPTYSGMGTTLSMCFLFKEHAMVAHVGDSRVYLLRDDSLHRITTDHSLVQELLNNGKITEAEAQSHPQKNVITRALGTEPGVEIDIYEFSVCVEDTLLLCSDGLSNMLSDSELAALMSESRGASLERVAQQLIAEANQKGGYDNITAVLLTKESEMC